MENYREIVSEYLSAVREKNAERAAMLHSKLTAIDGEVGVRSTPCGSYAKKIQNRTSAMGYFFTKLLNRITSRKP